MRRPSRALVRASPARRNGCHLRQYSVIVDEQLAAERSGPYIRLCDIRKNCYASALSDCIRRWPTAVPFRVPDNGSYIRNDHSQPKGIQSLAMSHSGGAPATSGGTATTHCAMFLLHLGLTFLVSGAHTQDNSTGSITYHQERALRAGGSANNDNQLEQGIEEAFQSNTLHLREHITFDIPVGRNTVCLQLDRNPRIPASLPIYLGTSEYSHIQLDNRDVEDFSVYQDPTNKASFLLWSTNKTEDSWNQNGIRGVFEIDQQFYSVESVTNDGDMMMSDNLEIGQTNQVMVNGLRMSLNKVDNTLPNDIARVVNETLLRSAEAASDAKLNPTDGHRGKRSFRNYEVELFLIIDYSVFKKWEKMSNQFYYDQRENDAIDNIRFYFAHVLNGMDLRYRAVREYDFEVTIRPVGIYIAKTREASYWTEFYPFKEGRHFRRGISGVGRARRLD
ncbi:hypothetical protein LSH36_57g00046 [Paralvinella palmiformis]|uniref:Uncharacterized protein n=1 Tax=Paralvinella palmiformis TaxID=53620 RepID=A0AAD9NE46_9ANNE|nr:hypothetical protein LSH36_57g00046 [Paralvinella palmiformis]